MILLSTEVFAEGKDYTSDPRGNSAEQKRVAAKSATPYGSSSNPASKLTAKDEHGFIAENFRGPVPVSTRIHRLSSAWE